MKWLNYSIAVLLSFFAGTYCSEGEYYLMAICLIIAGLNYSVLEAESAKNDTQKGKTTE